MCGVQSEHKSLRAQKASDTSESGISKGTPRPGLLSPLSSGRTHREPHSPRQHVHGALAAVSVCSRYVARAVLDLVPRVQRLSDL